MTFASPALRLLLRARARRGKEEPRRIGERLGLAGYARPKGELVWLHAASVGETIAVLPLLKRLLDARPGLRCLLTTGTVTSAHLAAERLPPGAIHQYLPLDVPAYVRRFLDAWRPDLAVLTEQEIWPNLLVETHRRKIPIALVNGRMSERTLASWRRRPALAATLLGRIDVTLTQTPDLAEALTALGAPSARAVGNLKVDAPLLPVDTAALARLQDGIGSRACLLAASTHEGEEAIVAEAHEQIRKRNPGVLTIIVPRHPHRGFEIAARLTSRGLTVGRRSAGEHPNAACEVYVADTIGELGTFYAAARVAFVGGSLTERGGQNPIEAIRLGSAVMVGPSQRNFDEIYRPLVALGGARLVHNAGDIATITLDWFESEETRRLAVTTAEETLAGMAGALERTLTALLPLFPVPAPAAAEVAPG